MTSPRSVAGTSWMSRAQLRATVRQAMRAQEAVHAALSVVAYFFVLTLLWNGESVERIFMGKGQFVMPGTAIDTGACP